MCAADVGGLTGQFAAEEGIILGHEAVGVVHELGESVEGFAVGDRVTTASATPCGTCADCQRGYAGHCRGVVGGGYQFGVTRDGTFADYFVVPHAEFNLSRIPDSVSDRAAICVPDCLTTGTTGPEAAGLLPGSVVAVFGQGQVGLGAIAASRAMGAGLIIAIKARPGGEEIARTMGADATFNLAEHDILQEIARLTGGRGADCTVEASGASSSFPDAVRATATGGTVVVLSSYSGPDEAALQIPLRDWGWGIGDKRILGTFARSGGERVSRILRLVENGRIDPLPLVTHEYRFDEVERAFADMASRAAGLVKPLIVF
jgi:threonine dehydrogenase-like Zn-dependent dehydrogenase